ncbi:MAG: thermonuclease family protein [Candidatus Zixiibacteriota bacterium]|nr:MAG: thermonuclease family protein [candidate division Zixibacteria bacterium]
MARPRKSRRKPVYRWAFVALLVVLILTVRLVEEIGFERKPSDRFTVKAVIDGDTVELLGGDRLRLLSIDTPEDGEPYYDEACRFLADIALGKTARIEYARVRRDRYGRLLGYLYIDSVFVNLAILENGLGNLYLFEDSDVGRSETGQLLAAQRDALRSGRGIWSVARAPEDHYVATSGSFRFHRPGCRSVVRLKPGSYRTVPTRQEALYEGLSPCRNCKP